MFHVLNLKIRWRMKIRLSCTNKKLKNMYVEDSYFFENHRGVLFSTIVCESVGLYKNIPTDCPNEPLQHAGGS